MNAALFRDKPPPRKPWVEQDFVLTVAKLASVLKSMEEEDKISHKEYETKMENIYSIISDYKRDNESN